jgi:hypothetical protein
MYYYIVFEVFACRNKIGSYKLNHTINMLSWSTAAAYEHSNVKVVKRGAKRDRKTDIDRHRERKRETHTHLHPHIKRERRSQGIRLKHLSYTSHIILPVGVKDRAST